jgi:hypothetical protein
MRELQTWMMNTISAPIPPRAREVEKVILPSHTLEPLERIEIYRDMYGVRMVEAIDADFPALATFLGHHKFESLALAYTRRYPSMSYTLNRLGDRFPKFIAEEAKVTRRAFLADLARLELAMTDVFDEAESPMLEADALAGLAPEELAIARLRTIAALRLVDTAYPVSEFFDDYRNERELVAPRKRASWIAVHRRDYSVYRMPLTRGGFAMLRSLQEGSTIGEAIDAVVDATDAVPQRDELFGWFRDWTAAGLFTSLECCGEATAFQPPSERLRRRTP